MTFKTARLCERCRKLTFATLRFNGNMIDITCVGCQTKTTHEHRFGDLGSQRTGRMVSNVIATL